MTDRAKTRNLGDTRGTPIIPQQTLPLLSTLLLLLRRPEDRARTVAQCCGRLEEKAGAWRRRRVRSRATDQTRPQRLLSLARVDTPPAPALQLCVASAITGTRQRERLSESSSCTSFAFRGRFCSDTFFHLVRMHHDSGYPSLVMIHE